MKIKIFSFNPFQVNTYILYDESNRCAIIDAACHGENEEAQLQYFLTENKLKPEILLNTHCHVDHLLGNNFLFETYGLKPQVHKKSLPFIENAQDHGLAFGMQIEPPVMPDTFIEEGQMIPFGNEQLKVIETPGHADGSVCFYHEKQGFLIAGDVLFYQSVGRTDLPTGNYDLLIQSIKNKLLVLPDETVVYCGHGPKTTIGAEKNNNPFLQKA